MTHFFRFFRALAIMIVLLPLHLAAQQYSYLPTGSATDDRFLSLTGGSIQTLGDNVLAFKLASPSGASSIEIGIFDGETGGVFDLGNVPLIFTLYADPDGDATGVTQVGEWRGDAMTDHAWFSVTVNNSAAARCVCGDYFYLLKVHSADPATFHWSNFKLRTNGTIAIARASNCTFSAPLGSLADAMVVYPLYPVLTPSNYNGTWHFHMDVTQSVGSLAIWDGDFDHGTYDCSENDNDDPDTPNSIPSWATGSAVAEGLAASTITCQDANGNPTGGNTTGNPPDDSRTLVFARSAAVTYNVVAPDNVNYGNTNPSGNLEWEQFRLSTDAFNRSTMDYHAGALPAGDYDIAINGMDLANLNAMRFPYDVMGVDSNGHAVPPIHPDYSDGSITGTLYYESGSNCTQGLLEPGIPLASVHLAADYNNDGVTDETWCVSTDLLGHFRFDDLHPGTYSITVDTGTLPLGAGVVCDSDGAGTPNSVSAKLTMCARSKSCIFGYRLLENNHLLGDLSR